MFKFYKCSKLSLRQSNSVWRMKLEHLKILVLESYMNLECQWARTQYFMERTCFQRLTKLILQKLFDLGVYIVSRNCMFIFVVEIRNGNGGGGGEKAVSRKVKRVKQVCCSCGCAVACGLWFLSSCLFVGGNQLDKRRCTGAAFKWSSVWISICYSAVRYLQ